MVRIIPEDTPSKPEAKPQPEPQALGYKHQVFLNVLGVVAAEAPHQARQLLEDYSIELSRDCPEEELADALIYAIGECDEDFNRDLASLILDRTLYSSYDAYDFKQIAGQAANVLSTATNKQSGDEQQPAGVLGGLTSAIGQIGGILSQGLQAVQSKSASDQTKLGIAAYRRQQAGKQQAEEKKRNSMMLILLLTAFGIGLLGLLTYIKRQAQPIIKT